MVLCLSSDLSQLGAKLGHALSLFLLCRRGGAQNFGFVGGFADGLSEHVHCICDMEAHEIQG